MRLAGPVVAALLLAAPAARAGDLVRHRVEAALDPGAGRIAASDTVTLPAPPGGPVTFSLHAGLAPASRDAKLEAVGAVVPGAVPVERWRATLPEGAASFTVSYAGTIVHPLEPVGEEYARGQSETAGTIAADGVFLAPWSLWLPDLGEAPVGFDLTVRLPAGWEAVSQGRRAEHERTDAGTTVRWEAEGPEPGVHLVAGPWTEYRRDLGPVPAYVFLREPDDALAARYLDATGRYIAMYAGLIGPYPYPKWALVENFWETGYGMPSFTLLGPRVVRLPFIVNTSYPHEILHSWWGNAVDVDPAGGNWAEGLTAYLADHLLKEQGGLGAEYRQTTLQKYADYVLGGRDLPLTAFRSRHGSVTEAVGYGKSLMLFHMLRREIGDDAFREGLRGLYRAWRFRAADFAAVREAFAQASGRDLDAFFAQWVERVGAPRLRLAEVEPAGEAGGWRLRLRLLQEQEGDPYRLAVPVAVTVAGQEEAQLRTVAMDGRERTATFDLPGRPLRVDVDPEFDLFRRLGREEIPPALSQAFGAERALIVLPSGAPAPLRAGYEELAASLRHTGPGVSVETAEDTDLAALPRDRSVWLLGWENRFLPEVRAALAPYDADLGAGTVRLEGTAFPRAGHAVVVTGRHPGNADLALLWIGADRADAMPGLARKLPHYHKYSYLGFSGAEPENVAKGRWPVVGSPLSAILGEGTVAPGKLPRREPLAEPPAVYEKERMVEAVRTLAAPGMEGRGFGTEGLDRAAEYVAGRFAQAGLAPGGEEPGSYFEPFAATAGTPPRSATLRNVIGYLPGVDPRFSGESVVIAAHYDHLGRGWPDVRAGAEGTLHPGADDNASGVAVLLEIADVLGRSWRPPRTVVFAAFSGEEEGRLGARHFIARGRFPVDACRGMINLDTVGRLGAGRLLVIGGSSAAEWVHVFRGAGFLAGVETVMASGAEEAGDQLCFLEAGVPAVQLFTGPHADYHRPSDVAGAIDADGLVKVAAVAREALEYLATRERPLTPAGSGVPAAVPEPGTAGGRRVSLGTVPDFAWTGEGVRLDDVQEGSPAAEAGLRAGDVVTGLAGRRVEDLRGYSGILRSLEPGQRVEVRFVRGGAEASVEVELRAR